MPSSRARSSSAGDGITSSSPSRTTGQWDSDEIFLESYQDPQEEVREAAGTGHQHGPVSVGG